MFKRLPYINICQLSTKLISPKLQLFIYDRTFPEKFISIQKKEERDTKPLRSKKLHNLFSFSESTSLKRAQQV